MVNQHLFMERVSPMISPPKPVTLISLLLLVALAGGTHGLESPKGLKERLKDEHASGADLWIYNDIAQAREEARKQDKPMFVTFRCVPCEKCAGFDAEVAKDSQRIRRLAANHFVAIRQVEMKGVDLTQFQFDYDLNWAAMFINADGTVYARYGTQSAAGPDAYNSIDGLEKTMQRVLKLHAGYPGNAEDFKGKRGNLKPYRTALEMPGLENREKHLGTTSRKNCIHCHNIHDALHQEAQRTGTYTHDILWKYPLPENLGLIIDADDGTRIASVVPGTPAEESGLKSHETIRFVNGQVISSIADLQWVLNPLPNTNTRIEVTTGRNQNYTLALPSDWKRTDISWRGSMWSLSPRLRVWAPPLTDGQKRERDIPSDQGAFLVRWINRGTEAGRAAHDAGLRHDDMIVALAGKKYDMTWTQFSVYIKLNYQTGDELPLTVLRGGKQRQIRVKLVE
jgi:hypothetical protein